MAEAPADGAGGRDRLRRIEPVRLALDDDRLARLGDEHRDSTDSPSARPGAGRPAWRRPCRSALTGRSAAGGSPASPDHGLASSGPAVESAGARRAAQVAAEEGQVGQPAGGGDGGMSGVEVGAVADGQPVDVVGRAGVGDVVDLDDVAAVGRAA